MIWHTRIVGYVTSSPRIRVCIIDPRISRDARGRAGTTAVRLSLPALGGTICYGLPLMLPRFIVNEMWTEGVRKVVVYIIRSAIMNQARSTNGTLKYVRQASQCAGHILPPGGRHRSKFCWKGYENTVGVVRLSVVSSLRSLSLLL